MSRRRLSAGNLRHRVTLESVTSTDDGAGGVEETWDGIQVWAQVRPLSSRELFAQGQVQGAITHQITIRYQPGVRAAKRVTWNGRRFEITGVRDENEEHRVVMLDAVEELA